MFSVTAMSVTVRPIGPAVSWLCPIGMIPDCETNPTVGLSPTTRLLPDGATIEPSVSVPIVTVERFAAGGHRRPGARTGRVEAELVRDRA